jgi:ATP-dependent helicase HrpB
VAVEYTPHSAALEEQVAQALEQAAARGRLDGDVLVFLPGAREIRAAMRSCEGFYRTAGGGGAAVVWRPAAGGAGPGAAASARRKVIFSTNVAESSVND